MLEALNVVVPVPSWFTVPVPEMAAETVVLLLWLKLIVPVPSPKAMVGVMIVPAASLVPKRPMFSVPEEPACEPRTMFVAATVPPLATVRVLLLPPLPTRSLLLFVQSEFVPVTSTLLLEADEA